MKTIDRLLFAVGVFGACVMAAQLVAQQAPAPPTQIGVPPIGTPTPPPFAAGTPGSTTQTTTTAAAPTGELTTTTTIVKTDKLIEIIMPYVMTLASTLIGLVFTWVGVVLKNKFNIEIDKALSEEVQRAATNKAGALIAQVGATAMANGNIDAHNAIIARLANDAIASVPDAVARYNITPAIMAEKIKAKAGLVLAGMTPDAATAAGAATVKA